MSDIFFSIILPVYNRQIVISNAIESVLSQSNRNWELIIVDDGSSDGTKLICLEYARKDPRIHYYYQENRGVCSARNNGLKVANGDYVIFLDSDNSLQKDALNVLNDDLFNCTNIDFLCYGYLGESYKWLPTKKSIILKRTEIIQYYLPTHLNVYSQDKNFLQNYVWNKCFRRNFLLDNNLLFDENRKILEDGKYIIKDSLI